MRSRGTGARGRTRVFELTGYRDADLIGRDVVEALAISDTAPIELVREWGVRRMGQSLEIRTSAGLEKRITADFFPAYDDDGGMLLALTPRVGDKRDIE